MYMYLSQKRARVAAHRDPTFSPTPQKRADVVDVRHGLASCYRRRRWRLPLCHTVSVQREQSVDTCQHTRPLRSARSVSTGDKQPLRQLTLQFCGGAAGWTAASSLALRGN